MREGEDTQGRLRQAINGQADEGLGRLKRDGD